MSKDKTTVSMKDIPEVEELKGAILEVASSGRARGVSGLEKDVYTKLDLSKEQRKYKIKGSSTTLLSNRYKDAISELKKEGALYSPSNGKVKLTDYAKQNVSHQEHAVTQQTAKTDSSVNGDEEKNDVKKPEEETLESLGKDFANKLQETVALKANEVNKSIASKIRNQVDAWDVQALNERLNKEYEEKAKAKANGETSDDDAKLDEEVERDTAEDNNVAEDSKHVEKVEPKLKYFLPFALVILGLFLSIAGLMPLSILLSIVAGCMTYFYTQVKQKKVYASKATYIIGAVVIVLSALLIAGGYPNNIQSANKEQEQTTQQNQQEDKTQTGKLMFIIKADGDVPDNLVFQVCVSGKTKEGKSVDNDYDATVGTKYQLDNVAGEYEIKVRTTSLTQNDVVYSVPTAKVNFDGENDYTAELTVTKDEDATNALAEKKKKEEEEKAADETKQKEEQEKAVAEAAAAQQQSNANANSSTSNDNKTVWVTASGKKYHDEGCRTLAKSKNKSSMTIAEAKAQGYTACGVCSPG